MSTTTSNQLFNNDWLITDTGAIDHAFIADSAQERAKSLYGTDCSASDVAYWVEKLTGMAQMKADQVRRDHFLKLARAA